MLPEELLLSDLSPMAIRVWAVLQRHANSDDTAFPSHATIAQKCRCADRTVRESIRVLEEAGWLCVEHRHRSDGSMTSNCYKIIYVRQVSSALPPPGTVLPPPLALECHPPRNCTSDHELKPLELKPINEGEGKPAPAAPHPHGVLPPAPRDEIFAYGKSLGLPESEMEAYWDYHETRGWRLAIGKNTVPIRDWRGTVRTWKRQSAKFAKEEALRRGRSKPPPAEPDWSGLPQAGTIRP